MQGRDPPRGFGRRPAFAHNLETFTLQQVLQSLPHQLVVIEDKDAEGLAGISGSAGAGLMIFHPTAPNSFTLPAPACGAASAKVPVFIVSCLRTTWKGPTFGSPDTTTAQALPGPGDGPRGCIYLGSSLTGRS
ncbi:hypothetical protein ARTHRO9AX_160071 [Arthrobacter sp. 9AX]|nr:hypothetical protein ARTHRO9AX_160071 [Arthrobacter sp. 9AX]